MCRMVSKIFAGLEQIQLLTDVVTKIHAGFMFSLDRVKIDTTRKTLATRK